MPGGVLEHLTRAVITAPANTVLKTVLIATLIWAVFLLTKGE